MDYGALQIKGPQNPVIHIVDADNRCLLTLSIVGGKMVAAYDPADLDDAAQQFVEWVLKRFRSPRLFR